MCCSRQCFVWGHTLKTSTAGLLAGHACLGADRGDAMAQELVEQTFRNLFPHTFLAAHPVHRHKVPTREALGVHTYVCLLLSCLQDLVGQVVII